MIDIGGNLIFWKLAKDLGFIIPNVTIVNLYEPSADELRDSVMLGINWELGDGTQLKYKDKSFDIPFSNSVIEHLGTWEMQRKFAAEVQRVAKNYWVQTPDKKFPIEPHLITPFIHWFPINFRRRLLSNFTICGLLTRPSEEKVNAFISEVRLPTYKEIKILFPKADFLGEKFFGLSKSLVAYYKNE